jgi:hypothetical protein
MTAQQKNVQTKKLLVTEMGTVRVIGSVQTEVKDDA